MPFDFSAVVAPFRMQPGLRRLAAGEAQLSPNDPDSRAFVEKLAALTDHWPEALIAAADFDAMPALRSLMRQAAIEHSDDFEWDGDAHFEARRLGWSLKDREVRGAGPANIGACLSALPPALRMAGLLSLSFAEDFAIIEGASARIPWLAVCLPSRWAPEEKAGRHFGEVHAPVADNQTLISAGDHLARLVTGTERWKRFVWTISSEGSLRQHPKHAAPTLWRAEWEPNELAAKAFFRTERQTFIPVPGQRQAVFTIHVESQPLTRALGFPGHARQVHDALATMSPAVLAYRGLADARDRLLIWLDGRANAPGPDATA